MFYKNPGKLRGIGKIQYPSRVIGVGLATAVFASNQYQVGSLHEWHNVLIVSCAIIYPHLALYIYWKSDSNKVVEKNMLLFDAFYAGLAVAFMQFNLLPTILMTSFTAAGTMVAKGVKFYLKGIVSIIIGAFIGLALLGFNFNIDFHLERPLLVVCAVFVAIYSTLFAFASNQFYIAIIKAKRQISHQQEIIEDQHKDILDSINYAKRIQHAILPSEENWNKSLPNSFVLYIPKDVVAGDFYWLNQKNGKVLFAAADCTGHGVPGAMVSVVCNNGLNRAVREFNLDDPGKILTKVRELVVEELSAKNEDVKDGMDIALISKHGHSINYAGAHNPLWIIKKGASEIQEIKANKEPIGQFEGATEFTTHELNLDTGDQIYIFSDGFADQFGGENNKKYKSKKFKEFLLNIKDQPIENQKEALEVEFNQWKGEMEQLDDICVIGIRI